MINSRKLLIITLFCFIISSPSRAADIPTQRLDLSLPQPPETKKQKSRMRKTNADTTTAPKIYSYRDMNYEQLLQEKDQLVRDKNIPVAIKYLKQLIALCDTEDMETIGNHKCEIADLLFSNKQYALASEQYGEFMLLHPGHKKYEYAFSQTIVSSFNCVLSYDRDQSTTTETLTLAEQFLQNDHFVAHRAEVAIIADACRNRLIQSEISICHYYLQRNRLKPAEKRLTLLKNEWGNHLDLFQTSITQLEETLAGKKAEHDTLVAANTTQHKSMSERF